MSTNTQISISIPQEISLPNSRNVHARPFAPHNGRVMIEIRGIDEDDWTILYGAITIPVECVQIPERYQIGREAIVIKTGKYIAQGDVDENSVPVWRLQTLSELPNEYWVAFAAWGEPAVQISDSPNVTLITAKGWDKNIEGFEIWSLIAARPGSVVATSAGDQIAYYKVETQEVQLIGAGKVRLSPHKW